MKEEREPPNLPHAETIRLTKRIRSRIDHHSPALQHAERQSHDGLRSIEDSRLAIMVGEDADAMARPLDALRTRASDDAAAGSSDLLGKKIRQAIVTRGDAKQAIALDGSSGGAWLPSAATEMMR